MTGQPFPQGAKVRRAGCVGAFCGGDGDFTVKPVVAARIGPTWRTARAVGDLCADCLADFAVMSASPELPAIFVVDPIGPGDVQATELPRLRVWAEAEDGLFHEVRGDVP
jgi:hypothetical protein